MSSFLSTIVGEASNLVSSAYRPPQWASPPLVYIQSTAASGNLNTLTPAGGTVNAQTGEATPLFSATSTPSSSVTTTYVFDAVLDIDHEQRLEKTHHPIQTGADISSHAYLQPARCVLYVLMSDAVDQYANAVVNFASAGASIPATRWTGSPSKSVSAYQTMISLQSARKPLTLVTRLRTYKNMIITSLSPREDHKTLTGLRMRVEFEQIFTASTAVVPDSARINDTASTGLGSVSTTPVADTPTTAAAASTTSTTTTSTVVNQFQYPPQTAANAYSLPANDIFTNYITTPSTVNIPGAGKFSSVPGQQGLP